jgi:hypothetical protein
MQFFVSELYAYSINQKDYYSAMVLVKLLRTEDWEIF